MADELGFPDNVIDTIEVSVRDFFDNYTWLSRPVNIKDPNQTIAMYADDWVPQDTSIFIGPQGEPSLSTYSYHIQTLHKNSDRVAGRKISGKDAKIIRSILYRDTELGLRLRALEETLLNSRERLMKFGIRRTRFLNNELGGQLVFLSQTDFWVETETTRMA